MNIFLGVESPIKCTQIYDVVNLEFPENLSSNHQYTGVKLFNRDLKCEGAVDKIFK